MKGKIIFGLVVAALVSTLSCSESKSATTEVKSLYNSEEPAAGNYHIDPDYKYEYRTGTSGNYEYNYDVVGTDEDGNEIEGNVDMQGKYGSGTITDANGDETDVDVEWVDYGEMKATDADGNIYVMGAD